MHSGLETHKINFLLIVLVLLAYTLPSSVKILELKCPIFDWNNWFVYVHCPFSMKYWLKRLKC